MIVVTGAGGQVGTALASLLPDSVFLRRAQLDLSHPARVSEVLDRLAPDTIINCAAYTAVDRAEAEEDLATTVNGTAVGELATWAASRGARLVTFSTDYVFPGDGEKPYLESDPTDPVNAYGRSKLAGELLALAHMGVLVIRTSWVVSGTHRNFVATMVRNARERELKVVDDQRGCPTVASDLAVATLEALDTEASGILHLTNRGETTWFEFAREAVRLAGLDPDQIAPTTTAEYPTPARRPAYSVLGSERRPGIGIAALPHWQDSLPGVVEGLVTLGMA